MASGAPGPNLESDRPARVRLRVKARAIRGRPGIVDFRIEAHAAMRAADGAGVRYGTCGLLPATTIV